MIDIKTTANFKREKYINSMQHKIYCYGMNEHHFSYLVIEWLDYPIIKEVHKVNIILEDLDNTRLEIFNKVIDCFSILKDLNLWETYREKYCLY